MSFFPQACAVVVGEEGGYSNDPNDPGKETKYGISKRAYPNEDIPNLTLERAQELYKRDYWDRFRCDALSWEMALITFDAAVNQGQGFAHTLPTDPIDLMATRALRYVANPNFERFGKGWMRRLFTLFKAAQVTPHE
jgi:lysozyme family protein